MTTITIENGKDLPQKTFSNWEELRNILNFMALQFKQTKESSTIPENLKEKPLSAFNYLTDESL
ncbi:hypothetical protein FORMB_24350 [Formosa sp. Hel1_33_131]|jgi:hypothetical protein|uniref:hypothetical protein n=1 Tax=Formosa sp. Hel1_33_131 TaxID=1336794 RepID=UPI00084E362F|nr:hypothetical protein [Formosa sp. Hel1_33_131]AOR29453.1 hypothetical protein FORMB_24350 [Formosa sp. Hel1_33_131]